jgi:hypothetical protein
MCLQKAHFKVNIAFAIFTLLWTGVSASDQCVMKSLETGV